MKVLHTEWSDGWGGQEIRIISEMEGVREKGVDVILACRAHSRIKEEALKRGFKVYILPFKGNTDFSTLFQLRKIIKKEKIDIVNTHSGKDTWVGGIAAKLSGVKFIRTRHLNSKINPSRLNFINEMADFIITTGEVVRENMIKYNRIKPEKIVSIPTGVDENVFNPKSFERDLCRKKFGFNKKTVIGALGVLRNVKGHIYLIKAAKELLKKYDNIEFVIAGDGPLMNKLKEEVEGMDFKLLGHTDPGEFLAAIDIFVLPSLNEGVPQSLIQALMMNKPSIVSNVGSVKDLYNGKNFVLIPPADEKTLADEIEKMLLNDIKVQTRDFMVENFSKNKMIEKTLEVYKKVLN